MSNVNIGLLTIAIFLAIFAATLIFGASIMEGHQALAILCASMFGMGLGVAIIEQK
jgi:hypothetical protein